MANPVTWFHISAKHVEALAKFYGEALDWKLTPGPNGMFFIDTGAGGAHGGLDRIMDGSDKSTIHTYVDTPDIDAQLARIERAGGRPAGFKFELSGGMGWISGFIDPEHNFVGLWQRGPEAGPAAPAAPKRRAPAKKAAKKTAKKAAPKKTAKKAAKKR